MLSLADHPLLFVLVLAAGVAAILAVWDTRNSPIPPNAHATEHERLTDVSTRIALLAAALLLLAGCAGGPNAAQVADELGKVSPTPHPRDNTSSCAPAGCVQLITTDVVSVYEWPDESTARIWAGRAIDGGRDQVGVFVLSYSGTDQARTSADTRASYAARLRAMVAAG